MSHNWSATKQRLHPQSVVEIAAIQFCQGTGFDSVRHHVGFATRTQISVCKSPFPSAGAPSAPVLCVNGSAETTVAEGGRKPVAGLWGHTVGEN